MDDSPSLVDLTSLDLGLVAFVYGKCVKLTDDARLSATTKRIDPLIRNISQLPVHTPQKFARWDELVTVLVDDFDMLDDLKENILARFDLADFKELVDVVTDTVWASEFSVDVCARVPIVKLMDFARLSPKHLVILAEEISSTPLARDTIVHMLLGKMSLLEIDVGGVQLALTLLARPPSLWADETTTDAYTALERHMDNALVALDNLTPLPSGSVDRAMVTERINAFAAEEKRMRLSAPGVSISTTIARLGDESKEVLRDLEEGTRRGHDKHVKTRHEFHAAVDTTRAAIADVTNIPSGFPSTVTPTPMDKDELADIADVTKVLHSSHLTRWTPSMTVDRLTIGEAVFAAQPKAMGDDCQNVYDVGTCVGCTPETNEYEVEVTNRLGKQEIVVMGPDSIASTACPAFQLIEGMRCIGRATEDDWWIAGTVGARPSALTNYRYLLVFDDGRPAFMHPDNVRLLWSTAMVLGHSDSYSQIRSSWRHVAGDVSLGLPPDADRKELLVRDWVQYYLKNYPEIPQPKAKVNDTLCVYRDGRSHLAKVLSVDHQLLHMSLPLTKADATKHGSTHITETLHRGSWRFKQINDMRLRHKPSKNRASKLSSRSSGAPLAKEWQTEISAVDDNVAEQHVHKTQRSRKSTMSRLPTTPLVNVATQKRRADAANIYEIEMLAVDNTTPVYPAKHAVCTRRCLHKGDADILSTMKNRRLNPISPLLWPMTVGWRRDAIQTRVIETIDPTMSTHRRNKMAREQRRSTHIIYRTPCGRGCMTLAHVTDYLSSTASSLSIDLFSFDAEVDPRRHYKLLQEKHLVTADFTKNGEPMVGIRAVNASDNMPPDPIDYVSRRYGNVGHELAQAQSGEWTSCCDCQDDCQSNETCACRRLTEEGIKRMHVTLRPGDDGNLENVFAYRRFNAPDDQEHDIRVISGIYECGPRCPCSRQTCHNRVSQTDMKWPVELFKTAGKGWGVRALCDIPARHFICTYAGAIHDDDAAEALGALAPDNDAYFADSDLIAVYDNEKNRNDLDNPDVIDGSSFDQPMPDSDVIELDGEVPGSGSISMPTSEAAMTNDKFTVRKYFERDNGMLTFVVDARLKGNIGRYMNHSCDPNVQVQNMLVDTHDLRLPWMAFFSRRRVLAGEELCWFYSYEKNDERRIDCNCGAENCIKRMR